MTDPRARPTLFAPLVGIPAFLLFFVGALVFARIHARAAENVVPGIPPAVALADAHRIPNGAYVEVEGTFERHEHGVWVDGAREVAVHRAARTGGPQRVVGRVCDVTNPPLGCEVPKDRPLHGERWFVVGATPDASRERMMIALAIAAVTCALYVALALYSRRRRKGPARVVEERTWTLRSSSEEVALAVRTLNGTDRFQVVDEGPGRVVFIQGYSENAARGWGVLKPEVFPRRASVTWRSSPREPTQVAVRVEEDLLWWPSPLTPSMDRLARESVASTMTQIERVLGIG